MVMIYLGRIAQWAELHAISSINTCCVFASRSKRAVWLPCCGTIVSRGGHLTTSIWVQSSHIVFYPQADKQTNLINKLVIYFPNLLNVHLWVVWHYVSMGFIGFMCKGYFQATRQYDCLESWAIFALKVLLQCAL